MKLLPITLNEDQSNPIFQNNECRELFIAYEEYYQKIGYHLPWVGYFVIKDDNVVGSCGFKGQPQNGKVEIAYWTFKEFEGHGISSFSCKKLVEIVRAADTDIIITATTAPETNASTRILEKNGFVFKETVQDDEIGNAWLWVLES